MFDVGFWEILLIGIVALVVVGPERLPEVARTVGKWIAKGRRFVAGVKSDLNAELESGELHKILGAQKEQIQELKTMVDSTRKELETSTRDAVGTAKENFEEIQRKAKLSSASASSDSADAADADSGGSKKGMQATSSAVTGSAALSSHSGETAGSADAATPDSSTSTTPPQDTTKLTATGPDSTADTPEKDSGN